MTGFPQLMLAELDSCLKLAELGDPKPLHRWAIWAQDYMTGLEAAALKVVQARHYHGDDGWDRLKNAIGELEDLVGRGT